MTNRSGHWYFGFYFLVIVALGVDAGLFKKLSVLFENEVILKMPSASCEDCKVDG